MKKNDLPQDAINCLTKYIYMCHLYTHFIPSLANVTY